MRSYIIARKDMAFPTGNVVVSLVHITLTDHTEYYEVAALDTRPLDLRKHRWTVVESYATKFRALDVFAGTVDAIHTGHRVVSLYDTGTQHDENLLLAVGA